MNTFKGPLDNHRNYIVFIALENFHEYCLLVKANEERGDRSVRGARYKELRYFLNAVESFNNIADYLYFDTHSDRAKPTLKQFRAALHKQYPCLKRVADIANAYKHCVRERRNASGKWEKDTTGVPHAADLVKSGLSFETKVTADGILEVGIDHRFEAIDDWDDAMDEAFRFWVGYVNNDFTIDLVALTQ